MKTYFAIKNENGSYLKIRTGSNGAKRAWVKTLKAATIFAEGQAKAAVEELKNSPYYDGLVIEQVGEADSAWQVKLRTPVTKNRWHEMPELAKVANLKEINETYEFSKYEDAETAAYNVRLGYENDPEWFHFVVDDLDDFEKDVSELLIRFFF